MIHSTSAESQQRKLIMSARTLLVTGASGHLGHRVVELLLARGSGDQIVAGSRKPESLADLVAKGAQARAVDFEQSPEELAKSFAGVDRLLIVSTDAVDRPGHRLEQHERAVAAAKAAGVKHILYTSMVRPAQANPALLAIDHRGTESAVVHSGIPYTLLRNNWYLENLLGDFAGARATGVLATAIGSGRAAFVSREDCAAAAAGALASQEEKSSVREISGPELLGLSEIAAALSELGKEVKPKAISEVERAASLEAIGLPAGFAAVLANSDTAIAQGWFAVLSDDVRTLSGSAPRDLRSFLRDHRAELG